MNGNDPLAFLRTIYHTLVDDCIAHTADDRQLDEARGFAASFRWHPSSEIRREARAIKAVASKEKRFLEDRRAGNAADRIEDLSATLSARPRGPGFGSDSSGAVWLDGELRSARAEQAEIKAEKRRCRHWLRTWLRSVCRRGRA